MSTYFIGDVHGCYDELMALLEKVHFNRDRDRLIFVGDLINRGPKSLAVLRFVRALGESAQLVLGNHDISLIAYALGLYHGRHTDFPEIMQAPDSDELVDWLRQQPLLIRDESLNCVVVHAGIPPRWSLEKAMKHARKAEKKLRGDKVRKYLKAAYQGKHQAWHGDFDKYDKFRYRLNGFTRMRYCGVDGEPDYRDKCPLGQQSQGLASWFAMRRKYQNDGSTLLLFGHWAALGFYRAPNAICLDSGCAWGGQLTAITFYKKKKKIVWVTARRKKMQNNAQNI